MELLVTAEIKANRRRIDFCFTTNAHLHLHWGLEIFGQSDRVDGERVTQIWKGGNVAYYY
jgi:hypothetical protein